MRVLYLITRSELGGAQIHLLDLLGGFCDHLDMVVGVGEDGYLVEKVRNLGIPCHVVPHLVQPMRPVEDLRAAFELVDLIRRVKPDVVHTHTSKVGVLGRLAARLAGVPSVFTAHTWCFAEGTSWKWKAVGVPSERLAARCSSSIINVSEANRKLALSYRITKEDRLLTIHNGIIDSPYRARPDRSGIPTIAVVGRCAPQKDQALFLRALSELPTPVRALIVGDGPTRPALEADAERLGIRDRVEFLGQRHDVAELLASAHIFALPTKWEGFPLSILEAMRAGLPVVASNVGGVAEAVVDGENGFLIPSGNSDGFREGLRKLIESPALRRQMGEIGRTHYEAKFTLEVMLRKTLAVYHKAVSSAQTSEDLLLSSSTRSSKVQADF
jgi:glycosyltransferase involved in cell wall biosynthesis